MPQSLAQIYLHLVFSTKNRQPFLQDAVLRDEMHNYLGGICNNVDCPSLRVGGVADHVHVLCRFGRVITVADLVQELKRESSKWVKTKSRLLNDFHGRTVTALSRFARATLNHCASTSRRKKNTTESSHFRTNIDIC